MRIRNPVILVHLQQIASVEAKRARNGLRTKNVFSVSYNLFLHPSLAFFSKKSWDPLRYLCLTFITVMQDKENMDPEVIKQTVSELQQSSLKVSRLNQNWLLSAFSFVRYARTQKFPVTSLVIEWNGFNKNELCGWGWDLAKLLEFVTPNNKVATVLFRSQHPPTPGNLKGGRWSSWIKYLKIKSPF